MKQFVCTCTCWGYNLWALLRCSRVNVDMVLEAWFHLLNYFPRSLGEWTDKRTHLTLNKGASPWGPARVWDSLTSGRDLVCGQCPICRSRKRTKNHMNLLRIQLRQNSCTLSLSNKFSAHSQWQFFSQWWCSNNVGTSLRIRGRGHVWFSAKISARL